MAPFRQRGKFKETLIPDKFLPEDQASHLRTLYQEVSGIKKHLAINLAELERSTGSSVATSVTVVNRVGGSTSGGSPTVLFLAFSMAVVAGIQTIPLPSAMSGTYIPSVQLVNGSGDPSGCKIFMGTRSPSGFDIDAGEDGTIFVTVIPTT